mmetsp:Transcript_19575/g.16732  ORF Transcript_19575/g.16732 Transcript_19575/m.16732 type:complete len:95 (-) Transcript_19575:930-1214(-)
MQSEFSMAIDCTAMKPSDGYAAELNNYFQIKGMEQIKFNYSKEGPDHCPQHWAFTTYRKRNYKAKGQTRKEAEKKVRSYIWLEVSGKNPMGRLQ